MDAKLFDKLEKVMRLAKSGVEGEAQTAAAILQKMLLEHNLSIADLEKKGAVHAPPVAEKGHDLGKAAFAWKLDLAEAVATYYYCHPLVDRRLKTVAFIGRPDNVESLQMLYAWLIDQIKRIAREERTKYAEDHHEHIDPLRWQVNFGVGAVQRLEHRLEKQKQEQTTQAARNEYGDIVALAIHHETENQDFMEQKYGYRTDGRETKRDRERREKYEEIERKDREWLVRDPDGYYARYPWRRPMTEEQRKAREDELSKLEQIERKRRERNRKKRMNYIPRPRYRDDYDPEKERAEDQAYSARESGKKAADRINLTPFITGHTHEDSDKQLKASNKK